MREVNISRYQDQADDAHDLTPLCLGALKLLDDFAAAAATRRADGEAPEAAADERTDSLLLAALGLLSLRRTVWRWASQAAGENATQPQGRPEPPPPFPMLR